MVQIIQRTRTPPAEATQKLTQRAAEIKRKKPSEG